MRWASIVLNKKSTASFESIKLDSLSSVMINLFETGVRALMRLTFNLASSTYTASTRNPFVFTNPFEDMK